METKINNSPAQLNRVDALRSDQVDQLGRTKKAKDSKNAGDSAAAKAPNDYDVNLSPQAREMLEARAKAVEIARNTPDVREDRVAELKKKIQSGAYKVDPEKVADGILKEALMERLAESDERNANSNSDR